MIPPDRVAEILQGLRYLASHPSLEQAQQLLDEWTEDDQIYDATASGWARMQEGGLPK